MTPERQLEDHLIETLRGLKYEYRADIRDRAALEENFRDKFETLNHVRLTDGEFQRLLDEIVTPDVFTAAHTLRNRSSFTIVVDMLLTGFDSKYLNTLYVDKNLKHHALIQAFIYTVEAQDAGGSKANH